MLTNNLSLIKQGFKGILSDIWTGIKNLFISKEEKLINALSDENAKLKAELDQLKKRLGM